MELVKMAKLYDTLVLIAKNAAELSEEEFVYAKKHFLPILSQTNRTFIAELINAEIREEDVNEKDIEEEKDGKLSMLPDKKKDDFDLEKKALENPDLVERGLMFHKSIPKEIKDFISQYCEEHEYARGITKTLQNLINDKFGRKVSLSTINRIIHDADSSTYRRPSVVPDEIMNQMNEDGLEIIEGDVYLGGIRPQHFIGLNFEKCIEYKGQMYPVKYIVAQKYKLYVPGRTVRLIDRDVYNTRPENIAILEKDVVKHTHYDEYTQIQICESLVRNEGDVFKTMDYLYHNMKDTVVSITSVRRILNKDRYTKISDKYFSMDDVLEWKKNSRNHITRIICDPAVDKQIHTSEEVEQYEYVSLKKTCLTTDEKEFICRYLFDEEINNHTKIQKISSVKNKIKAVGFTIKTSFIKAVYNKIYNNEG